MTSGRKISHPPQFYEYLDLAMRNGVGECNFRRRVRKGYSYEVAARHWDGVELTEAENIQEIKAIYKNDMPLKKSYLKYLANNPKLLNELIKEYGYTKQMTQLMGVK